MTWPTGNKPSPKQLVQRKRYTFKGYITSSLSRARGYKADTNLSMKEKICMCDMIDALEIILNNCDLETKLQIRNTK